MGLLDIGKQEGSQIIPLFGRGVRLKGKDLSLKRRAALPGEHPQHIKLRETLNIFAVRATYMAQFREYPEREGVETEPVIELALFIRINEPALKRPLVVPRVPEKKAFHEHAWFALEREEAITVRVDLSVRVQALESTARGLQTATVQTGAERRIPDESLALVDWNQAYLDLLDDKARKGWSNLILQLETPRQLIRAITYTLIADAAIVRPRTFVERRRQETVTATLRTYTHTFYCRRRERRETENWDIAL